MVADALFTRVIEVRFSEGRIAPVQRPWAYLARIGFWGGPGAKWASLN